MKKCCIVISEYREFKNLNRDEKNSLYQTLRIFGTSRDIFLLTPEGLNVEGYDKRLKILRLPGKYFVGTSAYSNLCTSTFFYETFQKYEYMLITQSDAWTFRDDLDYFCSLGYDYIGAPWYGRPASSLLPDGTVGNGGYSLRKISTFTDISKRFLRPDNWPEDAFFSLIPGIEKAPEHIALQFSIEEHPDYAFEKAGRKLPMGCHAYARFGRESFWKEYIPIEGYEIASSF